MNNRWFVSVLLIFTVLIVCIGGVSAADNVSDNQSASSDVGSGSVVSDSQVVDSDDSVVGQEDSISDNNQILGDSDDGIIINSSADLEGVLNDQTVNNTIIYLNNQSLVLNNNYTVNDRNLTFCGGSSLDDGKTSIITKNLNPSANNYYMSFKNGNITFKNIIFSDIMCNGFIISENNITFENVSFINIKTNSELVFNKGNCTFKDCNFVNSNGTIYTDYGGYSCLLDNCSFDNCDSRINAGALNSNNFNITNSRFNNCNGTLVQGFNLKNCIINGTNSVDDWSYFSPVMYPDSVVNCTFINNIAYRYGGAIYARDSSIINCTFVNNSALYGGAIYYSGIFSNMNISNCIFVNNSATIAGGAITVSEYSNSFVNNCTFVNNSAGVCGGAILVGITGNFAVSNSTFSGNNASDYGNDIYYYVSRDGNETVSQLILLNNSEDLELYINNDSAGFIHDSYSDIVVDLGNNTTGFCIELNLYPPVFYYAYFNNTNLAINMINHEYVGDYLKYLIYNYYGEIPNDILSYAIWSFTNYPYFDSNFLDNITLEDFENDLNRKFPAPPAIALLQLPDFDNDLDLLRYVINDTLNSVDNGVIIPDNGATKLNEDGSYTVYDFDSMLSSATQNLITVKTSSLSNVTPDISIIKITNNPVVYKGNDTSFDIVVTNNGTVMLSNVTVTEDSYDDLVYKSSSNITGNWTYNYVNGKHTWTLTGYLAANQSASFNVVFTTVNSTIGNKTNVVSVTTNENVTGNASNITEVIENNTTNNNTPNTTDNNTPNKPTPVDNGTVENNNTPKADIKTTDATGYPFIPLIIALIGMIGIKTRRK